MSEEPIELIDLSSQKLVKVPDDLQGKSIEKLNLDNN